MNQDYFIKILYLRSGKEYNQYVYSVIYIDL